MIDDERMDLESQLRDRGWNTSRFDHSTNGVRVLLRPAPYTEDFPGMETRSGFGESETAALRDAMERLAAAGNA